MPRRESDPNIDSVVEILNHPNVTKIMQHLILIFWDQTYTYMNSLKT